MDSLNTARPMIMHIDLNSCFATIEQQSRPLLRNRPVAVVNRRSEHTAIVTASYEAKARGVRVGMRLPDARLLCPALVAVETDPPKYRYVFKKFMGILEDYSPQVKMKSIDEGLIDFAVSPKDVQKRQMVKIGQEIKQRLKIETGEYMRCNVGIGPNRFLAKVAAGMNKPDGLTEISHNNVRHMYEKLELEDLTGIAKAYGGRLRKVGITTPLEFLDASEQVLVKQVFHGKVGRDWYLRLRGWEVDDVDFDLKSVGRQFVLDERGLGYEEVLRRMHGLTEDVAVKLRSKDVAAKVVRIYVRTPAGQYWQNFHRQEGALNDERGLFEIVQKLFLTAPLPALEIGVTCTSLVPAESLQPDLFGDLVRAKQMTSAIDQVNNFWGQRTMHSADTLGLGHKMSAKIPFGGTRFL